MLLGYTFCHWFAVFQYCKDFFLFSVARIRAGDGFVQVVLLGSTPNCTFGLDVITYRP